MKVRLAPTSIRLRLDPAEIPALTAIGALASWTALPDGGRLGVGVELGERWAVALENGFLRVTLDRAAAAPLLDGTLEGVHADLATGGSEPLRLIVERDRGARKRV